MSDKKMRLELHDFLNRDGICRHLEKMAEKGWLLEKMGGLMWTYRRISPQKLKFALYYSPTADEENAEAMEKQNAFYEMCRHDGWEFACADWGMQVFYNQRPDPVPLETEPALEVDRIHTTAMCWLVPYWLITIPFFVLGIYQQLKRYRNLLAMAAAQGGRNSRAGFCVGGKQGYPGPHVSRQHCCVFFLVLPGEKGCPGGCFSQSFRNLLAHCGAVPSGAGVYLAASVTTGNFCLHRRGFSGTMAPSKKEAGEAMHSKKDYIGVFDSGLGGISVLRELVKAMPQERFLYFGDSANAPYGQKPVEAVRQLTLEAAEHLFSRGVKALVVACNTATAAAIDILREQHPEEIIVGIEPALKVAADRFPTGQVGVMATEVTLHEEKFLHLAQLYPALGLHAISAPGLVELVEAGKGESPACETLLRGILAPYVGKLDALVLGCTHYPFARGVIAGILGERTQLLDGGAGTARQTLHRLEAAELLSTEGDGDIQMENSLGTPEIYCRAMELLNK